MPPDQVAKIAKRIIEKVDKPKPSVKRPRRCDANIDAEATGLIQFLTGEFDAATTSESSQQSSCNVGDEEYRPDGIVVGDRRRVSLQTMKNIVTND